MMTDKEIEDLVVAALGCLFLVVAAIFVIGVIVGLLIAS